MNIIKRCFTAIVSATMCAMVLVQPFGDNLLTLKPELVSYAVASENSTAENYADVVMNNYDMYSELLIPDEEAIPPVGRTLGSISFMDLDFDGDLEFFIHFQDAGTGRISTASIFKIVDDSLQSIIKSEYFVDGIEGLYYDTNGEKFYLCYENSGGFGGVAYSLCKMYIKDGQLVNEELFRGTYYNDTNVEYYQNGEKIDVTEDEYNARIEQYKSSLTNLNLSYEKSQSFNSFNGMNDEEKREFLINSYNAFNYDGFEKQEDNIPDDNNKSWQELYADELRNYMSSNKYTDETMFDLYDIDNDDIPELFISEGSQHMRQVDIYTIYQGELINLGCYGSYGYVNAYINSHLMYCYDVSQGYESKVCYTLKDGIFNRTFFAYSDADAVGKENATYKINDEIVTSEKYEEELSKYNSDDSIAIGRKYTLDEETINSVLFNGGSEDDNNENQDKTYGDYTYLINENDEIIITKYTGSEENVEIPSEIDGKKVTTISGIEGPADLEYQRIGAFEGNSAIKSVVIPDTVTKIEMNSFRACDNLQNVTISENIQTIEQNAFNDCNLSYIYLPESISDIGDCAFGYSGGSVIDGFVIYGFIGTSAETYANDNDILFIARNSDDTIIQPLALTLDYEKISDYSTLPNDDTVDLMKYPVYKVTAKVKNIDLKTANNVGVKINPSAEMTLINGSEIQTVETINSNEEVTFTWTLKIDTTKSYSTMCDVIAKADNSVESQSYLTITFDSSVMEKDNRFDFTRDTWWFTNSLDNYPKGYYIQDKYLQQFLARIPNTSVQNIKNYLKKRWTGSCYGMSVVSILAKMGVINISNFDSDATCVHNAKNPKSSDEISSLINAYQVSVVLPPVQNFMSEFNKLDTHEKLVQLINSVENVKNGEAPVAFYLYWYTNEISISDSDEDIKSKFAAHEMVAYDIERLSKPAMIKNRITGQKEPYTIKISIYDCSTSGDKPIFMYVNSDLTHWNIPVLCAPDSWNDDILGDITKNIYNIFNATSVWWDDKNEGDFYDKLFETLEARDKNGNIIEDYAQDIREYDSRPMDGGRYNTLYYAGESDFAIIDDISVLDCFNWQDFTKNYKAILTSNKKTQTQIKWNNIIYKFWLNQLLEGNSGDISVFYGNAGETSDGISQANINYVLPSLTGEYIVSDPDGKPTDIDYSLTYENSMVSVEASAAKEVTFNVDSVKIQADNSDYEVALTFNEGYYDMPWYTISASGDEANEVSMSQTDEGIVLSSNNMENVKISANNTDETIELTFTADTENVLISNNENNLEVYEDINSDGIYETLVSTTAFNNEVDSDETNVTQDNNTNNLPTSPENNDNLKSDINTKSISTNSAPETGDNVIKIVSTLLLAVTAMIVFRKRK